MKNVVLQWSKPASNSKIKHYTLLVRDDSGEVLRETRRSRDEPIYEVPDRKLKSGSSYFFCVDTVVKYEDGELDVFKSNEIRFATSKRTSAKVVTQRRIVTHLNAFDYSEQIH